MYVVRIFRTEQYFLANRQKLKETFHADSIGYLVTVLTPIPGPALRVVTLEQSTNVYISSATQAMAIDLLLAMGM